jgi:hypothetical protein
VSAFIPGQELSRLFYRNTVRPILDATFPGLRHSAALLGRGSDVLGFDDEMSTDHDWTPRVLLFLGADDRARLGDAVREALSDLVPRRFGDQPTDIAILTLRGYLLEHLDFDVEDEIEARDWLTFPEHRLRMITAGAVYHDDVGLQAVRERLAYYPLDVWLYLLVAGWWRVHPEVNLVGRVGSVGDELGSALMGGKLVRELMRLCFLMERQYVPYAKWVGTAFSRLACAKTMSPILSRAVDARTWRDREDALMAAYEVVASMHEALHITPPVATEILQIWDRPFKVLWGDFPGALTAQIQDPAVLRIAEQWPIGGADEFRDLLWNPRHRRLLLRLFE